MSATLELPTLPAVNLKILPNAIQPADVIGHEMRRAITSSISSDSGRLSA
jgi:hypothetical protein